ncbi:hypothetical protein ABPG75_002118 [Micractinium tetrahymenae]
MPIPPARPTAMLQLGPASRLACSLRQQGSMFSRVTRLISVTPSHHRQQERGAAAALAAATEGSQAAAPGPQPAAAQPAQPHQQATQQLTVLATSPTATQLLAHFFACELRPADCYLLFGSVGAGKSYFSRAFIRAAAEDEDLPVPSPTFLLQNIYTEHAGPPIHHFDLYRLAQEYDLARLDLPASFSHVVCLVEWAERLQALGGGAHLPADHLAVRIAIVEAAEQARLRRQVEQQAAAAQQQQQQQQHAGGSDGSSGRPGLEEGLAGCEEDEQGYSSSEAGEEDGSGDLRWRRIQVAVGGGSGSGSSSRERWEPRLQLLRRYLAAEGPQLGCYLLEGEGAAELGA